LKPGIRQWGELPIKIQCGCGQKYAFDVEPVNGRMADLPEGLCFAVLFQRKWRRCPCAGRAEDWRRGGVPATRKVCHRHDPINAEFQPRVRQGARILFR